MTASIDFTQQISPPRISGAEVHPLAIEIKKAAGEPIGDLEPVIAGLFGVADDIQRILNERDNASTVGVRLERNAYQVAWSSFHSVLVAKATVRKGKNPIGPKAAKLLDSYFPEGVAFTLQDGTAGWSDGQRRLDRMVAERKQRLFIQIVGNDIFTQVTDAHRDLGRALGLIDDPTRPTPPRSNALAQALAQASYFIGRYLRLKAAACDERDPKSVERYLAAIAPVESYRRTAAAREERPATPVVVTPHSEPFANRSAGQSLRGRAVRSLRKSPIRERLRDAHEDAVRARIAANQARHCGACRPADSATGCVP